jgi:hypothetical protein
MPALAAARFFTPEQSEPGIGSLRIVRDEVINCMDPDDVRPGLLVQEYYEDSNERAAWRTICPLTDAEFMVDACPVRWMRASMKLRDMMERGERVSLEDELQALREARFPT